VEKYFAEQVVLKAAFSFSKQQLKKE